jgi:hypothetical protein
MTTAQIAQNRAKAIATTRANLGLNDNPTTWTYEQRQTYNKALANYIATNPDQFGALDLQIAEGVAAKPVDQLEDDSFDWAMFAKESTAPALEAAQSIGQGVFTAANLTKFLIPVAAIIAVVILLTAFARRTGAAK